MDRQTKPVCVAIGPYQQGEAHWLGDPTPTPGPTESAVRAEKVYPSLLPIIPLQTRKQALKGKGFIKLTAVLQSLY